nr:hypothetical protein [uncultured Methanobrevibacter sp.]
MVVSDYFTDDDLISQLRLFFDEESQWDTDFRVFLNHIIDRGADFYLEFRGRKFSIDKITGVVSEVN